MKIHRVYFILCIYSNILDHQTLTFQSMVEKKPCRLISSAPSAQDPVEKHRKISTNETQLECIICCRLWKSCSWVDTNPVCWWGSSWTKPWAATGPLHSGTEAFPDAPCGERQTAHSSSYFTKYEERQFRTATLCDSNRLLCSIAPPLWEYSLQNQVHSFFAVLPLKWQRSSQHLKLGDRIYNCDLYVHACTISAVEKTQYRNKIVYIILTVLAWK